MEAVLDRLPIAKVIKQDAKGYSNTESFIKHYDSVNELALE